MYRTPFSLARNVLFSVLPVCLLWGCTGGTAEADFQPVLDPSFTVQAQMEYADGQQATLALTRLGDGQWDMTFSEPSALSGVTLSFDGEAVSASYKGLQFTVPKSALGAKTMLLYVTDVLDSVSADPATAYLAQDDGTWSTTGDCDGGSYTLVFTSEGELASFSLPNQPLTLTFSDYVCSSVPAETTTTANTPPPAETTTSAAVS